MPEYAALKGGLAPSAPKAPNHASAIEFKGQWYFFYHRGDVNQGTVHRRSACVDKMTFNEDGTIQPVVYILENEPVENTKPDAKPNKRKRPMGDPTSKQTPPESISLRPGI